MSNWTEPQVNEHWHCWGTKQWHTHSSPVVPICTHKPFSYGMAEQADARPWDCERWTPKVLEGMGLRPDCVPWTTRCVNDDPCPHSTGAVGHSRLCDRCDEYAVRNTYIANNQWYLFCEHHFQEFLEFAAALEWGVEWR